MNTYLTPAEVAIALGRRTAPRRGRGRPRQYGPGNPAGLSAFRAARRVVGARARGAPAVARRRKQRRALGLNRVSMVGGPESRSKFMLKNKSSKQISVIKKAGAPNVFVTNGSYQSACGTGEQQYFSFVWQGTPDLLSINSTMPTEAAKNYGRYVLESTHNELLLTNSSTATAIVDIYDIVRTRDANQDLSGNQYTFSPPAAWERAITLQSQGTQTPHILNSLPTDARLLKDYFKIVKRSHLAITQGGVHRHTVMLKPNRMIDAELLNQVDGDMKGIAVYTLVVFYGQPSSAAEGGAPAVVSTAPINLNAVGTSRYKYTWVADSTYNFFWQSNVKPQVPTRILNIGDGQFEDADVE